MNIFFRELRAYRNSLIFWSIGILFMVASGMAKFAAMGGTGQSVDDLMKTMPKAVQSLVGFGSFDTTRATGYYGMLFIYLAVMATIHAGMLGADIISKEERDKTSEFLFVKPESRSKIVTEKLLAGLTSIIIFNVVTLLSSIAVVTKYSKGESVTHDILLLMAGMFFLQLLFLSIGAGIAAISKSSKTPGSVTTGVLLFTFILSVAIDMNNKIEILKWITPFKYFDAKDLINSGSLSLVFVILSVVIVGVMTLCTYLFYKKRDLSI